MSQLWHNPLVLKMKSYTTLKCFIFLGPGNDLLHRLSVPLQTTECGRDELYTDVATRKDESPSSFIGNVYTYKLLRHM